MLRILHPLKGYRLSTLDDEFGAVRDFLFDDSFWTVRYMVADTGKWLPGRKVLISPISLEKADWSRQVFDVNMTREQIKNAPALDSDAPVSRRYEMEWAMATGIPPYWGYAHPWGTGTVPLDVVDSVPPLENMPISEDPEDQHRVLRSAEEVRKYHVQAEDGEIGHVADFIIDDGAWRIQYLVIDTRNWLPGRKVILAPEWFDEIQWTENRITTPLNRKTIKSSPEFDPDMPINREYEECLYDYYGKPVYRSG